MPDRSSLLETGPVFLCSPGSAPGHCLIQIQAPVLSMAFQGPGVALPERSQISTVSFGGSQWIWTTGMHSPKHRQQHSLKATRYQRALHMSGTWTNTNQAFQGRRYVPESGFWTPETPASGVFVAAGEAVVPPVAGASVPVGTGSPPVAEGWLPQADNRVSRHRAGQRFPDDHIWVSKALRLRPSESA
jgi:hypothetical protein